MSDVVPIILTQEQGQIKEEIAGKPLLIVFDGSSRLGQAMTIVARFISQHCMVDSAESYISAFSLLPKVSQEKKSHGY